MGSAAQHAEQYDHELSARKVVGEYSPILSTIRVNIPTLVWERIEREGIRPDTIYAFTTVLHEWIHHLQSVATSFGRFATMMRFLESHFLCAALKSLRDAFTSGPLPPFPLSQLATAPADLLSEAEAESAQCIKNAVDAWSHLILFLDGPPRHDLPRRETGIGGLPIPWNGLSPVVRVGRRNVHIGGLQVLEAQAHCNELECVTREARKRRWAKSHVENYRAQREILDPYTVALHHVAAELCIPATDCRALTSMLCDIALNPPKLISAPGASDEANNTRFTDRQWRDFHPGWRFVAAVNCVKRAELPTLIRREHRPKLCETICHELAWDLPRDCIAPLDFDLWPWHQREAFELRQSDPAVFAVPYETMNVIEKRISLFIGRPELGRTRSGSALAQQLGMEPREEYEHLARPLRILPLVARQMIAGEPLHCASHFTPLAQGSCPVEDCAYVELIERELDVPFDRILAWYNQARPFLRIVR